MKFKQWYVVMALFLLVTLLFPALALQAKDAAQPVQQEIGTNLLVNPGFEGIGKPVDNAYENYGNWTRDTFNGAQYGEIFSPQGWVTWWQEGDYGRPECKVIPNQHPFNTDPVRIYQGYYSGMCFGFYRKIHAGYYQVVRNIPPNSVVEGTFMAHAWTCGEDKPARSCGDPSSFYFRVGIDPNGGTDPFSANIIWSGPAFNYDTYSGVGPVQATVGANGVATIFLEGLGKWPNKHNDAYFDNPVLKLVTLGTPPTATPPPPPPTSDQPLPTVGPQYTATPSPGGSVIHTIVEGDTLFGIAITYGVDVDELRRLNAGSLGPNDLLSIGQEIVVKAGTGDQLTPTPETIQLPTTPETPTVQPSNPSAPPPATGDTGSICVLAFYDANGDMARQNESEMALPNAEITIVETGGSLTPYRTDGVSEPYCFQNLKAGQQYIVRHNPPPGYKTELGPWNLILNGGQVYNIELAYTRDQGAAPDASGTVSPEIKNTPAADNEEPTKEPEEGSSMTKLLNTIFRVSGIIVLVLMVVIVVLFFLSRRA
ncbi:MAG TPA: LysM peptidoglycan-binding domain-containing protein [Anaerolineae bacterium]|nr:LysM peptidoglycan-binding domain-containing protein [Anaerolineae bacterium]